MCCVALPCLFVRLTLLASYFLPSHLSLKHVNFHVYYISAGPPHQPQQCIPDVVVWMLAGRKRVACTRIPAHKLFYTDGKGRGQLCSKIQTLFLMVHVHVHPSLSSLLSFHLALPLIPLLSPSSAPFPPDSSPQPPAVQEEKELEELKDRALVRLMLWLEIEKDKSNFAEEVKLIDGEFAVYAETVGG